MTRNYTPRWDHRLNEEFWDIDVRDDAQDWGVCAVGEALRLSDLPTGFDYNNEDLEQAIKDIGEDLWVLGNRFYQAIDDGDEERAKDQLIFTNQYVHENGGRRKLRTAITRQLKANRTSWD